MDFLQELEEARMTRNDQNMKVLTYADCCEKMYLTLLVLDLMSQVPVATSVVRDYCRKSRDQYYQRFKMASTDLYNFIYFVNGDDRALDKLKDPGAAKRSRSNTSLPIQYLNAYLQNLGSGTRPAGTTQMFVKLENALNINNSEYKTIRRNINNWNSLDIESKKVYATKLIYAARAKLRNSDIIDDFAKFVLKSL